MIAPQEGRVHRLEHMLGCAETVDEQFVYMIVFDRDSDDMVERYLVGHTEEQVDGVEQECW